MADAEQHEWVQCKGQAYPIARDVCKARQARGEKLCRRCPERGNQMFLFGSPLQIDAPKKNRKRRRRRG